jgi:hypothetical protein
LELNETLAMNDSDDLFEFGDLEDDDSLEIDLDDLFGDLESLAIDVDSIEAGGKAAPVQAQAATAPAPAAAAPIAAAPVAAAPEPQPVYQAQVVQPVAPPQPVYAQPAPTAAPSPADNALSKLHLTKTSAAIAFATIITLANVAVTMSKPASSPNQAPTQVAVGQQQPNSTDFDYRESMLKAQVDSLEAQVQMLGSPAKPVPSSYTKGDHPAFSDVNDYFKAGLYPAGRQRLYNLLAIVDNFQPLERDAIESKASYMLADSWRMEAEVLALKESKHD